MKARFVGGSLDGTTRSDTSGAVEFVVPLPRLQSMTAAQAAELLSMHWEDRPRPRPRHDMEFYKRSLERDDAGRVVGFVYTYDRTETR